MCNFNPETTVYAHFGKKGEATNKRNGDEARNGCYACSDCHDAIDGRSNVFFSDDPEEQRHLRKERAAVIDRAGKETQRRLIAKGLMPK